MPQPIYPASVSVELARRGRQPSFKYLERTTTLDRPFPPNYSKLAVDLLSASMPVSPVLSCTCPGNCVVDAAAANTCPCASLAPGTRFNADGTINDVVQPHAVLARVRGCSPSCGCPPTCGAKFASLNRTPPVILRSLGRPVGHGIYTQRALPRGTFVGEYTGYVRHTAEQDKGPRLRKSKYVLACKYPGAAFRYQVLVIDSQRMGNFTRFINHAEGDLANVFTRPVFSLQSRCALPQFCLFTTRDVPAGAQLLLDYGEKYPTEGYAVLHE